ncbi:MAG: hypothetical protein J2P28_04485 [Actinobacteria bacterium]|nr:hypothetical protein [Actinomycetota bacterium]MBO0834765.1 hypothetical protein [Actinomycetota bacterium]
MRAGRGLTAAAAVIVGASAVAACSSATGSKVVAHPSQNPARAGLSAADLYQSPEQATLSWFYALNHKDMPAAVAHFLPAAAPMMKWYGGPSEYPTFSALHCTQLSRIGMTARVFCTFKELGGLPGTQTDSLWTVELQLQPDGRWLITNYGVA